MDILDWHVVVLAIFTTCVALAVIAMVNRRNKLSRLPSKLSAYTAQVSRLNTSVYKLYSPPSTPSMEVVFFHGFQRGDYQDAHLSTWKCGDGSSIWPQTWLVEKFCDARILSISYNGSISESCNSGIFDMYILGENLTADLLDANIGQDPCRPVVLVGHSFGGLVVKQVCTDAASKTGGLKGNSKSSFRLSAFLENIKGIFFYSTPHHGIIDNRAAEHFGAEGPLLQYVKTLSTQTSRLNYQFDNLWGQDGKYKMWQIAGLSESVPTKWGLFPDLVFVEEASARYGVSFNLVEGADHISVCRPADKASRSFSALSNFLELVATVSKATAYGLPDNATALERRVSEIQQKLGVNPVLGIVGMGGIGKTTLAKQLFNTVSRQFEYTCFVDNVKGMRMHEAKDWVLNHFLRNGTRVEPNSLKWPDLQYKKALIAMDDVDSFDQVRTLPKLNELGKGSLLIFTTRDQGVLDTFPNCVIYEVDLLNFKEAKELFCKHAFQQEGIPESLLKINRQLEKDVKKVVQKCDGLPLTLEVMGSYLRGHQTDASVWKETLERLGKAQAVNGVRSDRVWASLRISYDALADEEKEMFIEAGTYFFEERLEEALAAWSRAFEYPKSSWANLLRTSMVKEVDKTGYVDGLYEEIKYKEVWVHEHLRDMAKKEAKGAVNLLDGNAVEAHTTMVRLKDTKDCPEFQLELLHKLENLKYLDLEEVWPAGSSTNLSRKMCLLKWFSGQRWFETPPPPIYGWEENPVNWMSSDQEDLFQTRFRFEPWKIVPRFPISLEDMTDLAVLELKNWRMSTNSFETLGNFSNLRILSLSDIEGPAHLAEDFGLLSHLKRLELNKLEFTILPESFGNLSALEYLSLHSMDIVELPEAFGGLSSLATLAICVCNSLRRLPESFALLSSLATLAISHCRSLEDLPESFGRLSSLVKLRIDNCMALKCPQHTELRQYNFSENFSSLRFLCISNCWSLETLPACFGVLSSLEELELKWCRQLRTLPETFGRYKVLKRLTVEGLWALPDSIGDLTALKRLTLFECENLQRLPASFGNLSALQELELTECTQLQALPDNFGRLKALKKLTIKRAHQLKGLSDDFGNLTSLTDLCLSYCSRLERLPDNFGQLRALKVLTITDADVLQRLPKGIGQLHALKELRVSVLPMLDNLPEELGNLSSLEILRMEHCRSIESLPSSLGRISSLRELILEDCDRLRSLPDSLGEYFLPHGDGSTETRRPVEQQSQIASVETFHLHVLNCPFLDDSLMQRLGWIKSDRGDPRDDEGILAHCWGEWYQRKRPRGDSTPVILS